MRFADLNVGKQASAIAQCALECHKCSNACSETYDGASFMSFELNGMQARIKEIRWPELGFREAVLQT